MAIECVAEVINARKSPWKRGELMVLLMLANYADPDGSNIFPSVDRLRRAARLTDRGVHLAIEKLMADGVLVLVKEANAPGGRRTREYRIDMAYLARFKGCAKCGGSICNEAGCTPEATSGVARARPPKPVRGTPEATGGGPPKLATAVHRRTRQRPVIDSRALSPRAPDRRGDAAVWQAMCAGGLETEKLVRLEAFGASPVVEGDRVVIDFPKAWAERHVGPMRRAVAAAVKRPVEFRFAGRVVQC